MLLAIKEARKALNKNEIPIGTIIIYKKKIIAKAHNQTEKNNSPLAHAEILAITKALKFLKTKYLQNCELYTTLEPCPMCFYAIKLTRISKIYFGTTRNTQKDKSSHEIYSEIMHNECEKLLTLFFQKKR